MSSSPEVKTFACLNGDNPRFIRYLEETFQPEDSILREIRERSVRSGLPPIQVGPMDALHLEVLARAFHVKKVVEIGTLGGYSGVAIARALPPDGMLHTFDINPDHATVARESFQKAGLSERVRFHVGPALEKLREIESEGPFDLVFIDADKENYPHYLEWAARNLKVGGAVLGDNTFAFGMITDERFENAEDEKAVRALRDFNSRCAANGFRGTILPTGEGLTLAVKIR